MKIKLGIDIRMIRHTGIGTYIRELIQSLHGQGTLEQMGAAVFGDARQVGELKGIKKRPFLSRIYSVEEQLEYPLRLRQCDVWHSPHYNVPLFKGRTRLIVTIHDLIHWIFRNEFFNSLQGFYAGAMLRKAITLADHIITVSHRTREDILEYFDADPNKVTVIHEGVGSRFRPLPAAEIESVRTQYGLPKKYFLYVGSIKPHKNILMLILAYRRLFAEGKVASPLVLVGRKDRRYPEAYKELGSVKTEGPIIHLASVPTDDLVAIYGGATALIHPSFYEGFGLTLLEAMASGAPVIASRISSIPEVVGDAGILVDPCSVRELTDSITRMENIPSFRDELVGKGKLQAAKFSWEKAADQTAEIYRRVMGRG